MCFSQDLIVERPFFQEEKVNEGNLQFKAQTLTTAEIKLKVPTEGSFAFLNLEADEPQCDKQRKNMKPSQASHKQWSCHLSVTVSC